MCKYRIIGKTNGWIAQRDSRFNGRCEIIIADQLNLKDAQKKLLEMYNEDNSNYPSAPNWGVAVHQNRGAYATMPNGTRSYQCDSRMFEIEELPDKISDLLKEEIEECAEVEVYTYTGKKHIIHTDCIESLDIDINDMYCAAIDEFDYEVMNEDDYNNSVLANTGMMADFDDWYGNKNAKVLVVVLKNYTE